VATGSLDFTTALRFPGQAPGALLIGRSSYRAQNLAEALSAGAAARVELGRRGGVTGVLGPDTASLGALALGDVDGDGDLDLFAAGRAIAGAYPVPASSHLYRNEGGSFVPDQENAVAFRLVGLVSAASFTDLDADGDPDLALAVDWGPVKLFLNERGRFAEATEAWGLSRLVGGWKGLTAGDFDGDGRMDLVVTNWGRNLPFTADSATPLMLYVGNFGKGTGVDLVAAKYDERLKAIAPIAAFARLAWAIPDLRQRIPTFAQYADATIDRVLGEGFGQAIRMQITVFDHLLLLNRGGRFEALPLPQEAQFAPAFAAVAGDFDGDGREDLFLAQNFSQTELTTPSFNAGDGAGGLSPMPGARSGIVIYADQRGAATSDYDGDGRADLAVGENAGTLRLFHNTGGAVGLRVRLVGRGDNPEAIGAAVRVRYADGEGPVREIRSGSNYWSSDGVVQVLGLRSAREVIIRE
jgi:hypothetical protein